MLYAIDTIKNWFNLYYTDSIYLTLAVIAFIYLFTHCPELRLNFLLPMVLIMCVVFNPLLYHFVFKDIIYWRLFWMFPTAIIIGLAVVKMISNCNNNVIKACVLLFFCGFIVMKGTNVFQYGDFSLIQTFEKIPREVQAVCNEILSREEEPRCVMPQTLFCDARQYSGDIILMYGRNAHGHISYISEIENRVYEQMESETPNYDYVLRKSSEGEYNFVVTYENRPIAQEILNTYGYEAACVIEGYIIYQKVADAMEYISKS